MEGDDTVEGHNTEPHASAQDEISAMMQDASVDGAGSRKMPEAWQLEVRC